MGMGCVGDQALLEGEGPTLLLADVPAHVAAPSAEDKGAPLLSFISLNEHTAKSVIFSADALLSSASSAQGAEVSFGRFEGNSVKLEDPRASAIHFTVRVKIVQADEAERDSAPDGLLMELQLTDESSNGTWLNDHMVGKAEPQELTSGDRIFALPSARAGHKSMIGWVVVPALPLRSAKSDEEELVKASVNAGKELELAMALASAACCGICGEAPIHRCVTAVPCGHNFDLGCLVAYRETTSRSTCPCCNETIAKAVRNRALDDVTKTFLVTHPKASRNPATLRMLDLSESSLQSMDLNKWLMDTATPSRTRQRKPLPTALNDEVHGDTGVHGLPHNLAQLQQFVEEYRPSSVQEPVRMRSSACLIS